MKLNALGSRIGSLVAFSLMLLTPAIAHHSFDAEYDSKKQATISVVLTKIDWVNPHAYLYVEAKDASGASKNIRIELGPPYALVRGGWKRYTLKIGDKITVEGAALSKDGSATAGSLPTTFLTQAPALAAGKKLTMR